jgi:hypothetical protein
MRFTKDNLRNFDGLIGDKRHVKCVYAETFDAMELEA